MGKGYSESGKEISGSKVSDCRIVQQPVVLSSSLSYCPAACRIVHQPVVLSSSLSYCPAVCRIVQQPVVLSSSLSYCPSACRIVHQPDVLSSSLSYCPSACRIVQQPVVLSSSLTDVIPSHFTNLCVVADVARHREHSSGATGTASGLPGESVRLRHRAGHPSRSDVASARIRRGGAPELPGRGVRGPGHADQPRGRATQLLFTPSYRNEEGRMYRLQCWG